MKTPTPTQRIVAPPGHTQRSRLSIMAQHLCHVHWGFTIPGSVFTPPPQVLLPPILHTVAWVVSRLAGHTYFFHMHTPLIVGAEKMCMACETRM